MSYSVLLYYKFTPISGLETFRKLHQRTCEALGLKGRIFIASEGINGTVSGLKEATEKYKAFIESHLGPMEWKEDDCDFIPFAKLKTKVRKSLVNMGEADGVDVVKYQGKYLGPEEWKKALEGDEEYLLLDIRNKYEGDIGKFDGAIVPDLTNFHEFPKLAKELDAHKEKKILMYCTGGIRCVKFSAYLVKEGFKDVNQLHGGIVTYGKQVGSAHWKGSCFVFDDRLSVPIGGDVQPISQCKHCGKPESRPINCSDMDCNALFVCCDDCAHSTESTCCVEHKTAKNKRPFDPVNFRIPFRKKGIEMPELGLAPKK